MRVFLRDTKTKKKYAIKGINAKDYKDGRYDETELYSQIYEILIKHNIEDGEIIDKSGTKL